MVEPMMVVLPDESTFRYLVVPALLVTLKISTVPDEAWAMDNPMAVAAVGVMVWVDDGSVKIQLVQVEETDPQVGVPDPAEINTCPELPAAVTSKESESE